MSISLSCLKECSLCYLFLEIFAVNSSHLLRWILPEFRTIGVVVIAVVITVVDLGISHVVERFWRL